MKKENLVYLEELKYEDREKFIADLQAAFKVAVIEEFGDEEDGEVITKEEIEESLDGKGAEAYHIVHNGERVGGTVISIDAETNHNSLDLLFVNPNTHSKGIGLSAWKAIEELHPETEVWETHTPYFEKRNIHFYVNKCGFNIVEFFNPKHPDPHAPSTDFESGEYFFRFEKKMK